MPSLQIRYMQDQTVCRWTLTMMGVSGREIYLEEGAVLVILGEGVLL